MSRKAVSLALVVLLGAIDSAGSATGGDPEQGSQTFRACVACHSLELGAHRTGPSLAGILGRRAGTAAGFSRYSPAIKAARITWTDETLDAWLADPQALIPGNRMTFRGIGRVRKVLQKAGRRAGSWYAADSDVAGSKNISRRR